jgi:hypothetical protein
MIPPFPPNSAGDTTGTNSSAAKLRLLDLIQPSAVKTVLPQCSRLEIKNPASLPTGSGINNQKPV